MSTVLPFLQAVSEKTKEHVKAHLSAGTDYAYERKRERKALQQTPQQYMEVPGAYVAPGTVYSDPASNLPNFGTAADTPTFRGTEPPGRKKLEGGHLSWGDEELSSSGSEGEAHDLS